MTFFVRGRRAVCYLTDDHHGDGRLALTCAAPVTLVRRLDAGRRDSA